MSSTDEPGSPDPASEESPAPLDETIIEEISTDEPVTSHEAAAVQEEKARRGFPWNDVWVTVAAFVLAFIVSAIVMVAADPDISKEWSYLFSRPDALRDSWAKVSEAYVALFQGAFGSWGAITGTTAQAAPLICGGLAIGLGFKAGLFNIGGQGQAIAGATMAAWVGFNFHSLPLVPHLVLAMLAGLLGGAVWGGIAGVLKARAGANEVIVTIMLNYVASGLLAWLLTTKAFQMPGRTDPIAPVVDWNATFPRLAGSQLHLGFFIALLLAVGTWWLLDRTRLGFQIKAVGANPRASATAGMNVATITAVTMIISGALAGFAGVEVALGPISGATPTQLSIGLVGSIGFDAITVALLGRSRPFGTVLAGLFWGAMSQGGLRMQALAQTSLDLVSVIQAVIVMFVAAPMLVKTVLPFLKTAREKRRRTAAGSDSKKGALA
ncbi:Amino acid or sugar ABC transport system, permease protein [Acidipropionibacterium acidipropionici ATCC 4875]|uniref:Amino acid or sugar ABC transport system, permease protein n=1 Tax=Acidipropionibacterium acidipropionici (strain ATCC 4875 / DSM 20272 / JCM 6432 / NBRC 12425 / NCIMB 8070 / 4) TaxID=1171373 RepID=K7RQC1_ACIA4|nr:Amino acid or sugar ABC transport system, permease protein [Acidipropionibacterium acidipropionici ATCC 4875]QCV94531.1 ABC transporter permease [Acidipropionibacterium acidipropionici]